MSEWRTIRLGSACEKIGSGATPRGGSGVYQATGISLIRSQNIYNDGFKRDGLAFIGDKHARELENVNVMPGDVLLNITGDSVARVCQVPNEILPARVNQHVAIIRPRAEILDARFLHYFLIHPQTQAHMMGLAGAGATRNALTKGMIEGFEINAPSISEQRAIAEVLGALDDKIELNRQLNKTLEAMAQTVFQSWFVEPTATKLPKGWREVNLPEAIEVNPSRPLRRGEVAPYLDMSNMPTDSARALDFYDREFGSGMRFMNGDTLIARITPCLENGKTCFVDFLGDKKIGWGSTEYIVLHPKHPIAGGVCLLSSSHGNFSLICHFKYDWHNRTPKSSGGLPQEFYHRSATRRTCGRIRSFCQIGLCSNKVTRRRIPHTGRVARHAAAQTAVRRVARANQ